MSLASAPAVAAAAWHTYAYPRFGFSVEVPQDFRAAPPPANGDGRAFASPDGRGTLAVYGHLFVTARDIGGDAREFAASETRDGLHITYRMIGRAAYTLSGIKEGRIVYVHAVPTCGTDAVATLRAEYPADQKVRYDAIVNRMAASLHGSTGC